MLKRFSSTCPHDCPSTCALEVEVENGVIGRVHGSKLQTYTDGVICAKVARYAERLYHPKRLLKPLQRTGAKGAGEFREISWEAALDITAEKFLDLEKRYGAESIFPYYYAGTMGLVMRDGINRLRNAKKYSGFFSSICVNMAWGGYIAGTGKLMGVDPREMAKAEVIVIWGTNVVSTQVNVMTHAVKGRKAGAKIVVIDTYMNDTMKQADLALMVKPGSDGALALAIMHILFRDKKVNRAFLNAYTDSPQELEKHSLDKTPLWASNITGLSTAEIEQFAALIAAHPKTFYRLGYGFSRQKNGTTNMHAATCLAALTGAWEEEGGGAFHNNGGIYHWNKSMIEGLDVKDPSVRVLDQSRIGSILTGEQDALKGCDVKALFIQNTNPVNVAPAQNKVIEGFKRDDLFTVVHEHFLTDTAKFADIILPATMFLEHDDLYQSGGNQHIQLGLKLVEPAGETRSNHDLICDLAKRLGAEHEGFTKTPREIIDWTLQNSGWGSLAELETTNFRDVQPPFDESHFKNGFHYNGKFRFKPDWATTPFAHAGLMGNFTDMPKIVDYWDVNEKATLEMPFKLVTAPSRSFLNSTFAETPTSVKREKAPSVFIHPNDAMALKINDGDKVTLFNHRGEVTLRALVQPISHEGVLIAEGLWANSDHEGGSGINALIDDAPVAPFGGAAFHDCAVGVRKC